MKTYNIGYVLLALAISSCSKTDGVSGGEETQKSVDADYAVVLDNGNEFSTQLLNANAEMISLNLAESAFSNNLKPQLSFSKGSKFVQYFKTGDCSSTVIVHDFSTDRSEEYLQFDDLNDCMLTANAVSLVENQLFIGYELATSETEKEYMVRSIDLNSNASNVIDVALPKKPLGLTVASNRLFILTLDEQITEENSLSIFDISNNTLIDELSLGYGAQRIFTNKNQEIIISYEELHSTLNSSDLTLVYTQYIDGNEPNFAQSNSLNMDDRGLLYYLYDSQSTYPTIAGVYDFSKQLVTGYDFENFLTEEQRNVEFAIERATAVVYDPKNNLILIGYKKLGAANEGGLMRIKPVPDPGFIDNIDLEGIPYEIIVQ